MSLLGIVLTVFASLLQLPAQDSSKLLHRELHFAGDSVATIQSEVEHKEQKEGNWILHHIRDSHELDLEPFGIIHLPKFEPIRLLGLTINLSITKHVVFLWLAALILLIVLGFVARRNASRAVPKGLGNLIEIFVVFIRDEVILPTVGREGLKFIPYFLTLFFFILTCNLLGLVPYGSTATGNVSVTASLALLSFLLIQVAGIMKNGFVGYFKGLVPPGVPVFVLPVMIVVEFIGLFTKPFALCIRLFANMTAGHIVILSLISLIFLFKSVAVAPVSIAFALFINLLEIFIALLQAYIFTILSALFVGLAVHQEH